MERTRTYNHNGTDVEIKVDIHCGFIDRGNGAFLPINCIKYTVGNQPEVEINGVIDADVDIRLANLEKTIAAIIDGLPALDAQLLALGFN